MKKIIILPGCDDTNRGDQALVWETMDIAKKVGFDGDFYLFTEEKKAKQSQSEGLIPLDYILAHPSMKDGKEQNNQQYGISLVLKWSFISLLEIVVAIPLLNKFSRLLIYPFLCRRKKIALNTLKSCDVAFVKGGGFLHDYSGGIIETYKVFFLLYHIKLAISLGIPVVVMPNSFGPFNGLLSKRMVRNTLKKCKVVFSRESISKAMLKEQCNVNSILSPDIAVYLVKDSYFAANFELNKQGIVLHPQKSVGITVRPYRFPGSRNGLELYNHYVRAISSFIMWLKKNDFYVVLIEHVYSPNSHEQDISCIKDVKELLGQDDTTPIFSNLELNCRQMKCIYGLFDYVVGTRFHSVIFSLTQNIPCLAITYGGNKGAGIMQDMGLSEYSIKMDSITAEELINSFSKLQKNREYVVQKLINYNDNKEKNQETLINQIMVALK